MQATQRRYQLGQQAPQFARADGHVGIKSAVVMPTLARLRGAHASTFQHPIQQLDFFGVSASVSTKDTRPAQDLQTQGPQAMNAVNFAQSTVYLLRD